VTEAPAAARDQPLIAIDVVPVSFTTTDGLRVATARRAYDPYAGREALPGVLLHAAERLADGARRALRTKTGIAPAAVRHLAQVGAFDGPSRDPRETAISIAFLAVVGPGVDGGTAVWRAAVGADQGLPFDHDAIVRAAVDQVRTRLWRDVPLTRALLGDVFPTSAAAALHAALHGSAPDAGNLNRALRTNPALVRTDAPPASTGRGGRPPATWTWID
jgi:8-oxo-dGTP diphosphatase